MLFIDELVYCKPYNIHLYHFNYVVIVVLSRKLDKRGTLKID